MVDSANTEEFLDWVEKVEAWYEQESAKWSRGLLWGRVAALAASLGALLAAALADADLLKGGLKWVLVLTTFVSAFSTEIMTKLKVYEMEDLREEGHIEATRLARYARQKFVQFAGQDEQVFKIQDEVRALLYELDKQQHRRDVQIRAPGNNAQPGS